MEDVEEGEGEATGRFGGSASRVNGRGKGRSAGVVDGGDGDDEDEAYGPSASAGGAYDDDGEFAPGNDADYFVDEDDEGGRFFGGGLTSQQKRILELMNRAGRTTEGAAGDGARDEDDEGQSPEEELKSLRRCILRLERAINKNQELRVKYGDDPQKCVKCRSAVLFAHICKSLTQFAPPYTGSSTQKRICTTRFARSSWSPPTLRFFTLN